MPVLTKAKHANLRRELDTRYYTLTSVFHSRPLNNPREGAGTGRWADPDSMIATSGTTTDLSLAIADFKSILTEIGKLK
jgi:hypothetical protein